MSFRHGTQYAYAKKQCRCPDCTAWKAQSNRKTSRDGQLNGYTHGTATAYRYGCRCPDCKAAKRAENQQLNPRRTQEIRSERSLKRPRTSKAYALKGKYGLSETDYWGMSFKQAGKCLTCGRVPKRGLVVDHCHRTGRVRGLLCHNCNVVLGFVYESTRTLGKMIQYLSQDGRMVR